MWQYLIIHLVDNGTEVVGVSIPAVVEEDGRPRVKGQEGLRLKHCNIFESFLQGLLSNFEEKKV